MRYIRLSLAFSFLLFLFLAACRGPEPGMDAEAWLVHATDPHLFEEPGKKSSEEVARRTQEEGNREAFLALIKTLGSLPGTGGRADSLVITGDFGFGESEAAAVPATAPAAGQAPGASEAPPSAPPPASPPKEVEPAAQCSTDTRAGRMKCLIDALAASPLREIYVVPGNNDVEEEKPDALGRAHSFFAKVQEKQGRVLIHDLTRCYAGNAPRSQCWADLPGTSFRLVGFPSHSFKNKVDLDDAGAVRIDRRKDNQPVQEAQMKLFGELIAEAGRAGRKVLVVTHIAEMDDPYLQAQWKFARQRPVPESYVWQEWSAWNVSKELQQQWNGLIRSGTVAGVLAGHFHDSHREIYRWPRAWASGGLNRAPLEKVMLAPPLAVRLQDSSPIQARGFALIGLRGDELTRRLVWYDPIRKRFEPERAPRREAWRWVGLPVAVEWIWGAPGDPQRLARLAVLAIAFLAAFLTVVEVWQIPPPTTRPVTSVPRSDGSTTKVETVELSSGKKIDLLFQSNFARTVLTGLAGLALVSIFDEFWTKPGDELEEKPYFLVLFVVFFVALLVVSAILRGIIEMFRSRISLARRMPGRKKSATAYWIQRFWYWLLSLRTAFLCFFDTVFNVLQGKNQLHTASFEHDIAQLHESIIGAVDRIRKELDEAFFAALQRMHAALPAPQPTPPQPTEVRVNISLLSEDESAVFYISREEGSLATGFGNKSLAWLAFFRGRAFWWKESYLEQTKKTNIVLLDEKEPVYLHQYFEDRGPSDYKAFVLLPVPWRRRPDGEGRRGGIHVSFRTERYIESLWTGLDPWQGGGAAPAPPFKIYNDWFGLLEPQSNPPGSGPCLQDPELEKVVKRAIHLLEALFHHFNDDVFEEYIRPRTRPQ